MSKLSFLIASGFLAACASPPEAAPAAAAPTSATPTPTAPATATGIAAPPSPSAAPSVAGSRFEAEMAGIASMRANIAKTRAELDGQGRDLPRCKLDADASKRLTEQGAQLRAANAAYEQMLDALADEANALARRPDDSTIPVRRRDLEARLDELAEQIRRAQARSTLLSETVRACGRT